MLLTFIILSAVFYVLGGCMTSSAMHENGDAGAARVVAFLFWPLIVLVGLCFVVGDWLVGR